MMSTGLLERQEPNSAGQRGQKSHSYPPVGGVGERRCFARRNRFI